MVLESTHLSCNVLKMHLRVIVNGTIDQVQKWKNDLAAVWLPYPKDKGQLLPDGRRVTHFQMGVRTMEMVDLVFPEEQLDNVLTMVKPVTEMYIDGGKNRYPWLVRGLRWIRKSMNLMEVPNKELSASIMDKGMVSVHAVGLKQDLYDDDGVELL